MSLRNVIGTLLYNKSARDMQGAPVKVDGEWISAIRTAFVEPLPVDDVTTVFVAFSLEAVTSHREWLTETLPTVRQWNGKRRRWENRSQYVIPEKAHEHLAWVLGERINRIVPAKVQFQKNGQYGNVKITLRNAADISAVKAAIVAEEDPASPPSVFRGVRIVGGTKDETGITSVKPGHPLDNHPKIVVRSRTEGTSLDFSTKGKIRGFRDPEANMVGKYYVDDTGTAHVFFIHRGFREEINGIPVWFPPSEIFQYFSIRYDDTASDVIEMENRAGKPIRDSQELDRVIPDFLRLTPIQRTRRMQQNLARERGWSSVDADKRVFAEIREDKTLITAKFGRKTLDAVEKEKQRQADLTFLGWEAKRTGLSPETVLKNNPGFGEFLSKADVMSLTAPVSARAIQPGSSGTISRQELRSELANYPNGGLISKKKPPIDPPPEGFKSDPWKWLEKEEFPDGRPRVHMIGLSEPEKRFLEDREERERADKDPQLPLFAEQQKSKLSAAAILKQLAVGDDKFASKEKEGQ